VNINFKTFSKCDGYKSLKKTVLDYIQNETLYYKNSKTSDALKDYKKKLKKKEFENFKWVIDRVRHYSFVTGIEPEKILNTWERNRTFNYRNYYHNYRFPKINKKSKIKIVEAIKKIEFNENKKTIVLYSQNSLLKNKKDFFIFDKETCLFYFICKKSID